MAGKNRVILQGELPNLEAFLREQVCVFMWVNKWEVLEGKFYKSTSFPNQFILSHIVTGFPPFNILAEFGKRQYGSLINVSRNRKPGKKHWLQVFHLPKI